MDPVDASPTTRVDTSTRKASAPEPDSVVERAIEKKTNVTEQERERYRRAIERAIEERAANEARNDRAPPRPEGADAPVPNGQSLTNRADPELVGMLQVLEEDVIPLADECYEQALERNPTLEGNLGLLFDVIGDEEVGGLVESVELEEDSDIQDAEMIECIRETLFSTIFPVPEDSGSGGVRLTLRLAPEDPG